MTSTLRRFIVLAAVACALIVTGTASAIPSAVVHYGPSLPAALDQYAAPGNVIVVTAEQRNRNPARLRAWRAKGAIVMAYVNLVDHRAPLDPIEQDLYGGAFPSAWKYPGNLSNWGGTTLLNLTRSSPIATYNGFTGTWGQYSARWIREHVIGDGTLFNGVFLDVWGDTIWSLGIGGAGSDWEAGIATWGAEIRRLVGPGVFLVGNNTQTPSTAAPLNGRMWESFESRRSGWNHLTGDNDGLIHTFKWGWHRPQLDILWRNEAAPSADTINMLNDAAQRVSVTGTDIAVGSSNHQGGFPAPFGRGGGRAPGAPVVPDIPAAPSSAPVGESENAAGGGAAGPGATGARTLISTTFARGRTGGWSLRLGPRSRSRADRGALTLMAGRAPRAQAMASRTVPPRAALGVQVRLRIRSMVLPRGHARALISVTARGGARREAGVLRTADGRLRWATWTATAAGRRSDVRTSTSRAVTRGWVPLRLDTAWASASGVDRFAVGSATVVRARAGALAGRAATRVGAGIGPAGTTRAQAAVSLGSVRISAP